MIVKSHKLSVSIYNKGLFLVHTSCPSWVDWKLGHPSSSLRKEVPGTGTLGNIVLNYDGGRKSLPKSCTGS